MEWKIVYKPKSGEELNKIKRVQNHHHALQCCKGLGIVFVNISADDCAEGKPMALYSILSILIREELSKSLSILFNLNALVLKKQEESMSEFMSQTDHTLLLRWINLQLGQIFNNTRVSGLSEEWKDGRMFEMLLRSILGPNQYEPASLKSSEEQRIAKILQCIEEFGLNKKRILLEVEDIQSGEKSLISALLMSIFSSCHNSSFVKSLMPHKREELEKLASEAMDISLSTLVTVLPSSFLASSNSTTWEGNSGSFSGDLLVMGQSFLTLLKHVTLTMQNSIHEIVQPAHLTGNVASDELPQGAYVKMSEQLQMVTNFKENNVIQHVVENAEECNKSNQEQVREEQEQESIESQQHPHTFHTSSSEEKVMPQYECIKELQALKEENRALTEQLRTLTSCCQNASKDITFLLSTRKETLLSFAEYKLGNLAVDKVLSKNDVIRSAFCEVSSSN